MPEFSVILPLYNKEDYITNTLESVLRQTVQDFEVIIVDDGSVDRSAQIVSSFSDPRIRLFSPGHRGTSATRNFGIRQARGRFVCLLDADDVWEKDFLQTAKRLLAAFPEAGMVCPAYQVAYGRRIVHPRWRSVDPEKDGLVRDFLEMATAPFWVCNSSNAVFRRETLDSFATWFPETETVNEDYDFYIRIGTKVPVAFSPHVCCTYNRVSSSNARKAHAKRVVYSPVYMRTLDALEASAAPAQKLWVQEIRDRRMVPYLFSLLVTGERQKARAVLADWDPTPVYRRHKAALRACTALPSEILYQIYQLRLLVF